MLSFCESYVSIKVLSSTNSVLNFKTQINRKLAKAKEPIEKWFCIASFKALQMKQNKDENRVITSLQLMFRMENKKMKITTSSRSEKYQ